MDSQKKGDHILLVEDDDDAREALELLLHHEGFTVTTASSARTGLEILRRDGCDLLVTDYNLPDETGEWLIQAAARTGALLPGRALVITGNPNVQVDGVRVLPKPVDFDRLVREVDDALGRANGVRQPRAPGAGPRLELVLYVTSASIASIRAARNLHRILADYDSAAVELKVLDVAGHPEQAAEDGVDFTPTVVARLSPSFRLLGDLRNRRPLDDLLAAAGLQRR